MAETKTRKKSQGSDNGSSGKDKEVSKMEAERRKELPERPQPQRPEGFGQSRPPDSNGDNPPQRMRPDVFVDAHAHVGRIEFTLDGLEAHVRLHAQVLDLLDLSVGADASLDHVGLVIDDVQVDALVEVRLDAVENIVVRLIEAIDNNPEIIRDLTRGVGKAVENVGEGAEEALEEVGEGAGEGVKEIGKGTGEGVKGLGEGAGEGVKGAGEGVGKGVEGAGEGVGKGVEKTGEGVGKGVEETGKGVKNVVENDDSDDEEESSEKKPARKQSTRDDRKKRRSERRNRQSK